MQLRSKLLNDVFKEERTMQERKKFQPIAGRTYLNQNGTYYLCLREGEEKYSATFISPVGWKLQAHDCREYPDGTIDWDWSKGEGFHYAQPHMTPEKAKRVKQLMRECGDLHYIYGIRTVTGAVKDVNMYFKTDAEFNEKVFEIFCDGWNNQIYAIHLR